MVSKQDSNKARLRRHKRVRGKISGTAERPRLPGELHPAESLAAVQGLRRVKGVRGAYPPGQEALFFFFHPAGALPFFPCRFAQPRNKALCMQTDAPK